MKDRSTRLKIIILATIIVAQTVHAQELNGNLASLAPLLGSWEGRFEGNTSGGPVMPISALPILNGGAVSIKAASGSFMRESYYYWNPAQKQIQFLVLSSNGHIGSGVISSENALIVETGIQITPDGTTNDVRATWEVTPEGNLISRGYTLKDGDWQPGHVIILESTDTDR
ncbi:MAG: hypothetical protein JSU65_11950 [Candidatus Zixiibacteriota bacterium]|nr:MAG: hypothetical protein JSU65_11950 [candidate division Zixibacteria bacterium]